MAERKSYADTNPNPDESKPVSIRFPLYVLRYLDNKCEIDSCKRTDLIMEAIQNGEYYTEGPARVVKEFFASSPEIAEQYYKEFRFGRPHASYVSGKLLDYETLAVSEFINQAIDEKIAREAPDYIGKNKEERKEAFDRMHKER